MTELLAVAQEYLQFTRALPAVMVLLLLWSWETVRPLCLGRQARLRHAARNLSMAAVNGLVLFFTLGLVTTLLATWTADNEFGLLHALGAGWLWQLILGFLLLDAWAYLWHRANHRYAFLWRFHRLHHNDYDMDCTTSSRFHFGELAIAATTRLPVIVLFGLGPVPILLHETVLVAVSQFHHANIGLGRWDRLLRWWIVTPAMHHVHHSRRLPETNSNYASVLPWWDRLCRSFRSPEVTGSIALGLDEFMDPRWHTMGGMLRTPFAGDPREAEEHLFRPLRSEPISGRCGGGSGVSPQDGMVNQSDEQQVRLSERSVIADGPAAVAKPDAVDVRQDLAALDHAVAGVEPARRDQPGRPGTQP
jgi:sterol desaturase/sphingolipid hydroxylase (fatty acid hydroxylase superfamily)